MTNDNDWAQNPSDKTPEIGPTGKHPDGKIQEGDEGEIQFAVGVTRSGEVFIDFDVKVKWLALSPMEAIELAKVIAANAQKAVRVQQMDKRMKKGAGLVGLDGKPIAKE